jgi:hypothetical protein
MEEKKRKEEEKKLNEMKKKALESGVGFGDDNVDEFETDNSKSLIVETSMEKQIKKRLQEMAAPVVVEEGRIMTAAERQEEMLMKEIISHRVEPYISPVIGIQSAAVILFNLFTFSNLYLNLELMKLID